MKVSAFAVSTCLGACGRWCSRYAAISAAATKR
jgi:hypothetical protein